MQEGVFEGRVGFVSAVREAVLLACAQGCREMYWFDSGFVDWPLSDPALLAGLTAWARPPRRLHLLALQYDDLRRRHPRFVQWRGNFGHCLDARAIEPELAGSVGLVAGLFTVGGEQRISLRLFDAEQWRGASSLQAGDALRTKEAFDALAQRSCESFAATTLGL